MQIKRNIKRNIGVALFLRDPQKFHHTLCSLMVELCFLFRNENI